MLGAAQQLLQTGALAAMGQLYAMVGRDAWMRWALAQAIAHRGWEPSGWWRERGHRGWLNRFATPLLQMATAAICPPSEVGCVTDYMAFHSGGLWGRHGQSE